MQGNSSSETYLMSVQRLAYTMSRQPRVIEMEKNGRKNELPRKMHSLTGSVS